MESTLWSEDELVRELLDDESPLFIHENIIISTASSNSSNYSSDASFLDQVNFNSQLFSEPLIESASSSLTDNNCPINFTQELLRATSRNSLLERGMCKAESKYTLRIKNNGNVISDDGYKWRKYGQKSIKNSSNPRSYYRCTNPHCSAKKQVERSTDEPDTLIITYEGLHLHFTYPFLTMGQHENMGSVFKKPKISSPIVEAHEEEPQITKGEESGFISSSPNQVTNLAHQEVVLGPLGLLEDMVPFVIRNPPDSSHSSSVSSCPSPPTSPLSFSWSPPDYSNLYFEIGL